MTIKCINDCLINGFNCMAKRFVIFYGTMCSKIHDLKYMFFMIFEVYSMIFNDKMI